MKKQFYRDFEKIIANMYINRDKLTPESLAFDIASCFLLNDKKYNDIEFTKNVSGIIRDHYIKIGKPKYEGGE